MSPHEDVFGLVHPGRQVRRPPVVGMQFLHERPVRPRNLLSRGTLLKPENLIGFILGHRPRPNGSPAPRIAVAVSCSTPSGKPAVEISL